MMSLWCNHSGKWKKQFFYTSRRLSNTPPVTDIVFAHIWYIINLILILYHKNISKILIRIKLIGLSKGTPYALDLSLSIYIWEMYKNNVGQWEYWKASLEWSKKKNLVYAALSLSLSHTHTHTLNPKPSLSAICGVKLNTKPENPKPSTLNLRHTHSLTHSLSLSLSLSHTHPKP